MTYRFLPKSTLCLGKSVEILDLAADAALELGDLLRGASNARDPHFDSSVIDVTDSNGILQGVLLNGGEEVRPFDFAADSAFDPRYLVSASILQASRSVTGLLLR